MSIFPSTLVISSGNDACIQKTIELCTQLGHQNINNDPDVTIVDINSGWGIDQIRLLKKFLSQKPFNHENKIIIVFEADNLNTESQNALLKTLEEPGDNNFVILTTSKPSSLLPTIISRCSVCKINPESQKENDQKVVISISGNMTNDLLESEKLSVNKSEVIELLQLQLKLYQSQLVKNPDTGKTVIIKKIIKAIQMINANVDPKSALDYLYLS